MIEPGTADADWIISDTDQFYQLGDDLMLITFGQDHTGTYTCKADNAFGHIESEPAEISLKCKFFSKLAFFHNFSFSFWKEMESRSTKCCCIGRRNHKDSLYTTGWIPRTHHWMVQREQLLELRSVFKRNHISSLAPLGLCRYSFWRCYNQASIWKRI